MLSLLSEFLQQTYNFMNSIYVPGFNISFLSIFLGLFAAVVSIAVLRIVFGLGNSTVGSLGASIRGGNNKNIKIANDRKDDSY